MWNILHTFESWEVIYAVFNQLCLSIIFADKLMKHVHSLLIMFGNLFWVYLGHYSSQSMWLLKSDPEPNNNGRGQGYMYTGPWRNQFWFINQTKRQPFLFIHLQILTAAPATAWTRFWYDSNFWLSAISSTPWRETSKIINPNPQATTRNFSLTCCWEKFCHVFLNIAPSIVLLTPSRITFLLVFHPANN